MLIQITLVIILKVLIRIIDNDNCYVGRYKEDNDVLSIGSILLIDKPYENDSNYANCYKIERILTHK